MVWARGKLVSWVVAETDDVDVDLLWCCDRWTTCGITSTCKTRHTLGSSPSSTSQALQVGPPTYYLRRQVGCSNLLKSTCMLDIDECNPCHWSKTQVCLQVHFPQAAWVVREDTVYTYSFLDTSGWLRLNLRWQGSDGRDRI
jgi:hypothetical protein